MRPPSALAGFLGRVSIRARHECRAMRRPIRFRARIFAVSIRARHECRAMPNQGDPSWSPQEFQSAPGTSAGRCQRACQGEAGGSRFNPRPARVPGDAASAVLGEMEAYVSIRARHECRAMRACVGAPVPVRRFQSAPGTSAGRCLEPCAGKVHRRGFNPRPARVPGDARWRPAQSGLHRRFNPRPARVPGDATAPSISPATACTFQSAPGTSAGRCHLPLTQQMSNPCFNPRPARVPGDASSAVAFSRSVSVSIRARHECRAMQP